MSRNSDAGFTLLEILVALVVLGFLMAGLSGGVRLGMRAWDSQARAVAAHDELDGVDRALRRLIAGIDPGDRTHKAGVSGTPGSLTMTTELPTAADSRMADARLQVDGAGRLVLRWTPRAPGVPLAPPPPVQQAELLRGVKRLQLAYWPDALEKDAPPGWHDTWNGRFAPALIRIRLVLDGGRNWPDLVAAPARDGQRK